MTDKLQSTLIWHFQIRNNQINHNGVQYADGTLHMIGGVNLISDTVEVTLNQLDRFNRIVNYEYRIFERLLFHTFFDLRAPPNGINTSNLDPFPGEVDTLILP